MSEGETRFDSNGKPYSNKVIGELRPQTSMKLKDLHAIRKRGDKVNWGKTMLGILFRRQSKQKSDNSKSEKFIFDPKIK